jgi:ribosomal protein L18
MSGNEFFYIDADGKKQDAALHESILAGDHPAATEVGKEVARRAGISEDMILKLYAEPVIAAGNEDSARQIGIAAARRAGLTEEEIAKLYAPLDSSPDPNQKPE